MTALLMSAQDIRIILKRLRDMGPGPSGAMRETALAITELEYALFRLENAINKLNGE